ncbi:MAG: cytochrome c oxidase subunit 3 [Gammaproteobacteria bacterium]|nr:cytochrome c oxidase subunit 3 [Gammaproteobacteria bacterium]MCP4091056.1 cytochrome c oxidase subunit 3 [Gammaproteobacteria bacterium]MCP4277418.1 cytochrome c oxidase subunit 3 [Gammaproteobacteria bacterium]MCP4831521.1 cytochrome c oxidase subunit 3 [Gammaproteobacteria bacterium]MCP4927744.1 cytochrome c oxidase subunit 3 [Gammaproteobacteria bacterium]
MAHADNSYYIPHGSHWPLTGSIGLFGIMIGASIWLNGSGIGPLVLSIGFAVLLFMIFGWFRLVINESEGGQYNSEVDTSFRMGMGWFIFSEVMFFAAFFGALFYARGIAVPWLGGDSNNFFTNELLWNNFTATWPTNGPDDLGGKFETLGPWGIPALNTAILLTSGITLTIAHHALQKGSRGILSMFLAATFILGFIFMGFQAYEYIHAYQELNLTMESGIYGSTFFLLTGFHGLHVTIGATMLVVIWLRCLRGHFKPDHHFAFEAVAWYWHFVDVVWLFLFIFVYWL